MTKRCHPDTWGRVGEDEQLPHKIREYIGKGLSDEEISEIFSFFKDSEFLSSSGSTDIFDSDEYFPSNKKSIKVLKIVREWFLTISDNKENLIPPT